MVSADEARCTVLTDVWAPEFAYNAAGPIDWFGAQVALRGKPVADVPGAQLRAVLDAAAAARHIASHRPSLTSTAIDELHATLGPRARRRRARAHQRWCARATCVL
jgi:hypothetical protein